MRNCNKYSESDLKNLLYERILEIFTSTFTPKQLGVAFYGVCVEKRVDIKTIDIDTEFGTKAKAQKLFVWVCMKDDIGEDDDNATRTR